MVVDAATAATPLARMLAERGAPQSWLIRQLQGRGLEMAAGSMSALCAGRRRLLLEEAVEIAPVLGCSVEDLLPVAAGAGERASGGGE
jgi:plasmid maintenance system antidote protein VapI